MRKPIEIYNNEVKRRYLNSKEVPSYNTEVIFHAFTPVEEQMGKDIALFSAEEFIWALEQVDSYNLVSMRNHISALKTYASWYNDNIAHCTITHYTYNTVKQIDIKKIMRKSLFFSFDELFNCLKTDMIKIGRSALVIVVLLWMGLDCKEILNLERNDVTFNGNTITVKANGRKYELTHAGACEMLRYYSTLSRFTKNDSPRAVVFYEEESSKFIRRFYTDVDKVRNPMTTGYLQGLLRDTVNKFYYETSSAKPSLTVISDSSTFYRWVHMEKAGADIRDLITLRYPLQGQTRWDARYRMYTTYREIFEEKN